jgi:hypothetical protein
VALALFATMAGSAAAADTGAVLNGGFAAGTTKVDQPRFPGDPNPLVKGTPSNWQIGVTNQVNVYNELYPRIGASISPECATEQVDLPFVQFDVPQGAAGYIEQAITVPDKPFPLTFTTWGNNDAATVGVEVITADGVAHPLLNVTPRVLGPTPAGKCVDGAKPETRKVDLSSFAGQAVTLRFAATSTGARGAIANIDDVTLPAAAGLGFDCREGGRGGKPYSITAGELEAVGCWKEGKDGVAVTGEPVRINGIDLAPKRAGTKIEIDERRETFSTDGTLSAKVGFLPLPPVPAHVHWRARAVTLLHYEHKPSEPPDPDQPNSAKRRTLFGMLLSGGVELSFGEGKTSLKFNAKLPKLENKVLGKLAGLSVDVTVAATNRDGLVLDNAEVKIPSLLIRWVEIADATLKVSRTAAGAYHFDGKVTVYPFKSLLGPGFPGEFGWGSGDDYLKIGFGVENLNRPLAYGIFLQKIFASLQRDPFGVAGSIGATFGPQIRIPTKGTISAVRADGGFSYLAAHDDDGDGIKEPSVFKITGALRILKVDAEAAELKISGGKVSIDAKNTAFKVGDYGFESQLKGWVSSEAFNVEGSGTISLPGPDGGGEAVVSNVGAAACKRGFGPDIGWGYTWGDKMPKLFGWGCNLGSWRGEASAEGSVLPGDANVGSPRAQAGTARRITVAPHTRRLALRVRGTDGPPPVTFVAPDGTRYAPSAQPDSAIATDSVLAMQDPDSAATYLAVDRPLAGRWRVEMPPTTSGPVVLSRGRPLPPLKLRVRVTGRGPKRVLHYRAARLAGRHVTFVETGGASRRVIGETGKASGQIRFRPAFGPPAKRTVVALASLDGVPAPAAVVAHYHAGDIRPAGPRGLRIARRGGFRRVITWQGPRTLTYVVTVKTSDGRKLRYLRDGAHRRVAVDTVPDEATVRASVKAVSGDGIASAARRAVSR